MRNEKLGSEEFYETLLELTSSNILNDAYIEKYEEFCNNLIFDLWKQYYYCEHNLGVKHFADLLEIFFTNVFIYKPGTSKINEIKL